jgi:cytochrome c553
MKLLRERANHRSSHERRGACALTELREGRHKCSQARDRGERSSPHCECRAAEKTLIDKGEVLVKENCSRCHAIGKEGESPHKEAPPFRTLAKNYPIEDLAESLAEGIVSGHPDMPIFVFGPHDVEAIIEYLQSIQAQ